MTNTVALDGRSVERAADIETTRAFVHSGIAVSLTEDILGIEADWRGFEREADGTVFQSYSWLSTWQHHIGARSGVTPAIVIGRDTGGRIVFLLPLAVRSLGVVRELVWLGMELCDYTGPLLAPDLSTRISGEAFAAIWKHVLQMLADRFAFDLVRLEKMPDRVGPQANPLLSLPVTRHPSGAYQTALAPSWDEFYPAKRSSSTRRRDRTKRKNLAGLGDLRFCEPASPDERRSTIDILMAQKARSLARIGVSNFFERPGYADFYRAVTDEAIAHVSRLDVGEHPAAINLGLVDKGRYYHVLASYTDEPEFMRYGPGAAHLMDIMAYAIERGCTTFDFTVGDEPYKLDWCEERQTLYDHLSARTPKGMAAVVIRSVAMRAKRAIKENAALWDAFFKMRTLLGGAKPQSTGRG